MPKLKPLKFSDYANDIFNHDKDLESMILTLYVTKKLKPSNGRYQISCSHTDVYITCSRIEDTLNNMQPLKITNASLFSRSGSWNPEAVTSHTMIDKTTLYTLLKFMC